MAQSKHNYFRKGADWHAKSDITVNLKRPDVVKMAQWTEEERSGLPDYIATCEAVFKEFIDVLKDQRNDKR